MMESLLSQGVRSESTHPLPAIENAVIAATRTTTEIEQIAQTGSLLQQELERMLQLVRPGLKLGELRKEAEESLSAQGCEWKSLIDTCTSLAVNETVISFAQNELELREGDLLTVDLSAAYRGWWADCARTVPVGQIDCESAGLLQFSRHYVDRLREQLPLAKTWNEACRETLALFPDVEYHLIPELIGHGIGRELHETPQLNCRPQPSDPDVELQPGMVFTLEPAFSMKPSDLRRISAYHLSMPEGNRACYFEDTVALTEQGIQVLTRPPVASAARNLILVGMPGAGKSTIGKALAQRTGRNFIDLDEVIQSKEGRTLREIIEAVGLEAFLDLEAKYAGSLSATGAIVATGGSVVYRPYAIESLQNLGELVYLYVSPEVLRERLADLNQRGVVIAPQKSLDDLWREREPLYEACFDRKIDTTQMSPDAVVHLLS